MRFSVYEPTSQLIDTVEAKIKELKTIIPDHLKSTNNFTPSELLGNLLAKKSQTISTAESCTGGHIASLITSISGSSKYFKGSIVAYDNDVKQKILGVEQSTLYSYGAVSSNVVEEMANGVIKLLDTDFAIAISGIAGPNGATENKPVGTVWIAIASKSKTISKKFNFSADREHNIRSASNAAIMLLIDEMLDDSTQEK